MKQLATLACVFFLFISCNRTESPKAAFYYWKTTFRTDSLQQELLARAGNHNLYLRFFDVTWNEQKQHAQPIAVVHMSQKTTGLKITPVMFITNRVFEQIKGTEIDSLAQKCNRLVTTLAARAGCSFDAVQIDCDWTDGTRHNYFAFLKAFKGYSSKRLEATIRLHQVKYRERTGVPPVDQGILMFYNMGKISTGSSANSIYNQKDAAKYLGRLDTYPLSLDVALPLFSWVIQSRNGKVIQVYSKISRNELEDKNLFEHIEDGYRANQDFFMKGVYIKKNDIFKPEETNMEALEKAADQLSDHLPPLQTRTIIYYELANINFPEFTPEALNKVTDRF